MYQGDIPLIEEINEQDMDAVQGGTATPFTPATPPFISQPLGNHGMFCTLTKECEQNCQ